jgi:hypothetical protein
MGTRPRREPGDRIRPGDKEVLRNVRLADSGERPFLGTGDSGFLHDGILYLIGRGKEMMIY